MQHSGGGAAVRQAAGGGGTDTVMNHRILDISWTSTNHGSHSSGLVTGHKGGWGCTQLFEKF